MPTHIPLNVVILACCARRDGTLARLCAVRFHFILRPRNAVSRAALTRRCLTRGFAFYNIDMKCVVEPGPFTIYAGPDSVQLKSVKLLVS